MIPKSAFASDEAKEKIDKIKELESSIDREKLIYQSKKYAYDFRKFQKIRTFGEDMYVGVITFKEADEDQQI